MAEHGCQMCGELARKIDVLHYIEVEGKRKHVCAHCADTRWWEKLNGKTSETSVD